jgi:beta-phosphoglucomutase-like phosphatase (HAD superfamily)
MNLVIFDIDGTLTESVAVDEVCFVQVFRDVLSGDRRQPGICRRKLDRWVLVEQRGENPF